MACRLASSWALCMAVSLLGGCSCGGDDDDAVPADDAGPDAAEQDARPDGGGDGPADTPQLDDPQEDALERLAGASATEPEVRFDGVRPRFATFEVPVPGAATTDPVAQAFQFLAAYPELYGIADPAQELHLARIREDADAQHVVLGQHLLGRPVFGAELAVHLVDGVVVGTNGAWIPGFVDRGEPAILSPAGAEAVAKGLTQAAAVVGRARLVWWDGSILAGGRPEEPALAYRVGVVGGGTYTTVILSAQDGRALMLLDETRTHEPRKNFEIKTANNTSSNTCWTFAWEDGHNWFDENGPLAGITPSADGLAAFDLAHETYDAYYDTYHRHMWNDGDGTLDAWVHVGVGWNNAAYSWQCGHMRFADGWVEGDVFRHEFTHAVIRHSSDLEYADQPGALNESFADVMAELHDEEADWLLGTLRDFADPPALGQPDHMVAESSGDGVGLWMRTGPVDCDFSSPTYNDCGFVHTNSGIANKAWFLITSGGTHSDYTILGLERGRVRPLAYQVMTGWLTRNSQLLDARDAAVALARRWQAAGTLTEDHLCAVQNGWAAVGLGAGDRDCDGTLDLDDPDQDGDGLADAADNCPAVRNVGQDDFDRDGIGDRCDRDADGDGVATTADNCPVIPNGGQEDADVDGIGDVCEDRDRDGVRDPLDLCPDDRDAANGDMDGDGEGDACDFDIDGDSFSNRMDNCPRLSNRHQWDWDQDGLGDECDNCYGVDNPGQENLDGDREGDACDWDDDGDDVLDWLDLCPEVYDPAQLDLDGNGVGSACDDAESSLRDGTGESVGGIVDLADLFGVSTVDIAPCLAGGCPDWIGVDALTTVTVTSPAAVIARVVDDLGRVAGSAELGSSQQGLTTTIRFAPSPEMHFVAPGGAAPAFEGRSYHLVLAPADAQGLAETPVTVQVSSEGL